MSRVYLDHAASTPLVPAAIEAMTRELSRAGNPSSLHGSGRAARRVVEESRELIAECLGARPAEVIFTSGGTEADNLAVKGAFWAAAGTGRPGLVTSAAEHHAVLESVDFLARTAGAEVHIVGVDARGRVDLDALRSVVGARTCLVSLIWAGNEVGTVQPVAEVADWAHQQGALAHSDAVQAVGHLPVNFATSGLDLLTCAAHKFGGPHGIGALLARREIALTPVLHGGGQERDVRSGTLDVAAVAGFAAAVSAAVVNREREAVRLDELRAGLVAAVRGAHPEAVVYGPDEAGARLPGLAFVAFPGCEADALLLLLDAQGIDVSTGSACSAGVSQPSHVLLAMGVPESEARSALRFSLGHTSTAADVETLAAALPEAVRRATLVGRHERSAQ
jgi:cysteine desulfurase